MTWGRVSMACQWCFIKSSMLLVGSLACEFVLSDIVPQFYWSVEFQSDWKKKESIGLLMFHQGLIVELPIINFLLIEESIGLYNFVDWWVTGKALAQFRV